MPRYGMVWGDYVPVAERRQKAETVTAKLRKQGKVLAPVIIAGRAIATTFWGKAWCGNLEAYRDYDSRLPRGRSYARDGAVIDLQIISGEVHALVSGSAIYRISVQIQPLPQPAWRRLCGDCAGRIDSLVELLQGRFSKAVMARLCRQDGGLFPRPAEIRFSCSCPDHASMCKHVAAVLYGVGARLDQQPDLLFRLRAVDGAELVAEATADLLPGASAPAPDRVLQVDDMAALFGLDMAQEQAPVSVPPPEPVAATRTVQGVKSGDTPGVPKDAGAAKAGAASVKAGRRPGKTAAVVPIASAAARAGKAPGGKTAPRARLADQASGPPKASTAGRAAPKEGVSRAPSRAPEKSAVEPPLAVRDRAQWPWKALAAARKAKKA